MNTITAILLTLALALATTTAHAGRWGLERDYQNTWCTAAQGSADHPLPDRTEVDCLTTTHAYEFDWSNKWAEAIGQSLHYATQTQRRAGIILILRRPKDTRHWYRLLAIIQAAGLPIDAWPIWAKERTQ